MGRDSPLIYVSMGGGWSGKLGDRGNDNLYRWYEG